MVRKEKPGRIFFTKEEDAKLKRVVEDLGEDNWEQVAERMGNRTVRQCRDRWNNYLIPGLTKAKWTPQEDKLLIQKFAEFGTSWKKFEPYFPGRTNYCIRNHWKTVCRMMRKERMNKDDDDSDYEINAPSFLVVDQTDLSPSDKHNGGSSLLINDPIFDLEFDTLFEGQSWSMEY